jgi:hypothetical protein
MEVSSRADTLGRTSPLQDKFPIFYRDGYLLFLHSRKVGFENKGSVGLIEIELWVPFFNGRSGPPRSMDQLIEEPIDFLRQLREGRGEPGVSLVGHNSFPFRVSLAAVAAGYEDDGDAESSLSFA